MLHIIQYVYSRLNFIIPSFIVAASEKGVTLNECERMIDDRVVSNRQVAHLNHDVA